MASNDFLATSLDKLEFQLSKDAIESLAKLLFSDEDLNVNIDESKLFEEAVKRVKSTKTEEVLMLILQLDMVARISKRDATEARKKLSETMDYMKTFINDCDLKLNLVDQTLQELNLSKELIHHLQETIEHQATRISILEQEDKLSFLDQFNDRITQAVNWRTDALRSRLVREQELTRNLQQVVNTVASGVRNEIGRDSVEEIKSQLTNIQAVLAEISRAVKEDRVSEAQSQFTDHGMQTLKANEWLAAFMEIHQKNAETKRGKRASLGCIVM